MLGKELTLPDKVWSNLNLAWAVFFLACGLANIYVAFWLPQSVWVNFKVFGLTVLTLVFTLLSGIYIYRHMPEEQKNSYKIVNACGACRGQYDVIPSF